MGKAGMTWFRRIASAQTGFIRLALLLLPAPEAGSFTLSGWITRTMACIRGPWVVVLRQQGQTSRPRLASLNPRLAVAACLSGCSQARAGNSVRPTQVMTMAARSKG